MECNLKSEKGGIKIHVIVEVETPCVVAVEIIDERVGDASETIRLLSETQVKSSKLDSMFGHGAYDTNEVFNYCINQKIDPIIRVRKNSSTDARGSHARAAVVRAIYNYEFVNWKKMKGHGQRWSVGRAGIFRI